MGLQEHLNEEWSRFCALRQSWEKRFQQAYEWVSRKHAELIHSQGPSVGYCYRKGQLCGPNKNRNSLEDRCQIAHRVLMSKTGAGQEDWGGLRGPNPSPSPPHTLFFLIERINKALSHWAESGNAVAYLKEIEWKGKKGMLYGSILYLDFRHNLTTEQQQYNYVCLSKFI